MEWIKDYWYIIVLGLVAAMFFFGFRAKDIRDDELHEDKDDSHTHKSGHSCCH